ncbi:hypothetical protein FSP39_016326 [Pinctada imbricata]|uniref:DUF4326 domain-containing protein n=1 Tax=Pinctada imbricata TaxID=66713 RepID=A0AA89C1K3_PINIB|nr:hypothetical protein FSP39_016326 [Pinctada imbricata]
MSQSSNPLDIWYTRRKENGEIEKIFLNRYSILDCRHLHIFGYKTLKDWLEDEDNIYIGSGRIWDNPYPADEFGFFWSDSLYEEYIRFNPTKLENGKTLWENLDNLYAQRMACDCKYVSVGHCHGHILKKLLFQKTCIYGTRLNDTQWESLYELILAGYHHYEINDPVYNEYPKKEIFGKDTLTGCIVRESLKRRIIHIFEERYGLLGKFAQGERFQKEGYYPVSSVKWRFFETNLKLPRDYDVDWRSNSEIIVQNPMTTMIVDMHLCRDVYINVFINAHTIGFLQEGECPIVAQTRLMECRCEGWRRGLLKKGICCRIPKVPYCSFQVKEDGEYKIIPGTYRMYGPWGCWLIPKSMYEDPLIDEQLEVLLIKILKKGPGKWDGISRFYSSSNVKTTGPSLNGILNLLRYYYGVFTFPAFFKFITDWNRGGIDGVIALIIK